jgi:hypothetical protein
MKTGYTIFICSLLLISLSCESDKEDGINGTPEVPETPQTVALDVNDDGVDDFELQYGMFVWDGVGVSGFGISGRIDPLNENSLLFIRDAEMYSHTLFNKRGDTINKDAAAPLEWNIMSAELVTISDMNNLWPLEWNIMSENAPDSYYVGVKVKDGSEFMIGWLKLEINKDTGEAFVTDMEVTAEDEIVIDR